MGGGGGGARLAGLSSPLAVCLPALPRITFHLLPCLVPRLPFLVGAGRGRGEAARQEDRKKVRTTNPAKGNAPPPSTQTSSAASTLIDKLNSKYE